ncbi:MAG: Flp pilus assembly complex ATPase component TadA, partial [Brachybacterium sp.]|nr:Flp pilus assembly complex ATPase component TadA [Brachybacterium sp.]
SLRPAVSIRRNRHPDMTLTRLVELGTISAELASFFRAAIAARMNIVVGGATDAGKTTLLRALINEIDAAERLLTVEKALELGIEHDTDRHPDTVALEEVLSDAEGRGGVSIDELVAVTRRLNPSRVIVGEVMGPDVIPMLTAMSQGNNGSLSTVHARSATGVIRKLATYAAQHDSMDFSVTFALIAESIDFIVFIEKNRRNDGLRTVTEVVEVAGYADGKVSTARIFEPDPVCGRAVRVRDVAIARGVELSDTGWTEA